jgi:hypothetical protein
LFTLSINKCMSCSASARSWDATPVGCYAISHPFSDFDTNTARIQAALDDHSCVSLTIDATHDGGGGGGGDYPIKTISLPSHSLLHLGAGVRLVAVIGETRRALVLVEDATNVTVQGPGMLYGSAEDAISHYDDYDNRFEPIYKDGSPLRPHNLLVVQSEYILVQGISLHNASDWTFKMENSSHIWVDSVDIYGDSRFPNNDGTYMVHG